MGVIVSKIIVFMVVGFEHKSELLAQQKDHEQAMRDLDDELVHLIRQMIISFKHNEAK